MSDNIFTFYTEEVQHKSYTDKKTGKKRYFVGGHVDSGKRDLVDDIVTKPCMDDVSKQFKSRNMKLDFNHETLIGDTDIEERVALTKLPLGKATEEKVDSKGNHVMFELNTTWKKFDSKGDVVMTFAEIWQNIEEKNYDSFSIAYIPVKTTNKMVDGKNVRMLDKVNLVNVALTGNPINPDATITSIMAKSLTYIKSKEDTEAKYKKKAFDKDGAHAHTPEMPLGEHNHPEIELALNDRINWVHDRIDSLRDQVYNSQSDKAEDSMMIGKSNDGDSMSEEDKKTKIKAGDEEAGATDGDDAGTDTPDATTEGKAMQTALVEVKSMLEKTNENIGSLVKTIEGLQAKNKEIEGILAKARPAALGAESEASKKDAEGKSGAVHNTTGPLDLI